MVKTQQQNSIIEAFSSELLTRVLIELILTVLNAHKVIKLRSFRCKNKHLFITLSHLVHAKTCQKCITKNFFFHLLTSRCWILQSGRWECIYHQCRSVGRAPSKILVCFYATPKPIAIWTKNKSSLLENIQGQSLRPIRGFINLPTLCITPWWSVDISTRVF